MTASITEHSNGASVVIVIEEEGEHRVFGITETDNRGTPGQIVYELFHGHAVFNYSLLGEPNVVAEENPEAHVCEDEYA